MCLGTGAVFPKSQVLNPVFPPPPRFVLFDLQGVLLSF